MFMLQKMHALNIGSSKKPSFSYSGSWEGSAESWNLSAGSPAFSRGLNAAVARTGSYSLNPASPGTALADYVIPAAVCGGLTITASVWMSVDAVGGLTTYSGIRYKIGSGSFTDLDMRTRGVSAYALHSGTFDNPGEDDVTIRLSGTYSAPGNYVVPYFDDWSISGA